MQIKYHIAKAIQDADDDRAPDGFAESAGFEEHIWLSDWGAMLASRVIDYLTQAHFVILPKEPTEEMLNAARDWSLKEYGKPIGNSAAVGCYRAMTAVL